MDTVNLVELNSVPDQVGNNACVRFGPQIDSAYLRIVQWNIRSAPDWTIGYRQAAHSLISENAIVADRHIENIKRSIQHLNFDSGREVF